MGKLYLYLLHSRVPGFANPFHQEFVSQDSFTSHELNWTGVRELNSSCSIDIHVFRTKWPSLCSVCSQSIWSRSRHWRRTKVNWPETDTTLDFCTTYFNAFDVTGSINSVQLVVCERTFNSFLSGSIHGEVEPDCDNRILKRYFTDCFSGRVEQSVGCMYVCVLCLLFSVFIFGCLM